MPELHTSSLTPRLAVRRPTELDRPRFVELFCGDAFMAFPAAHWSSVLRASTQSMRAEAVTCGGAEQEAGDRR